MLVNALWYVQVNPDVLNLLLNYCRFHRAPGRSDKVEHQSHKCVWQHGLLAQKNVAGSSHCVPRVIPLQPKYFISAELVSACQERKLFDEKFIRLDTRRLCELTSAADALDMKPLVDLTSRALARMIEGKSAEEIRWDNCHVNQHAFHTRQFLLK